MQNRVVFLILALTTPALAYIDPVTGNLIVQGLIAALAACGLFYRRIRQRVRDAFGGKDAPSEEESEESTEPEDPTEGHEGEKPLDPVAP